MKLNWGTGIALTLIAFAALMSFMVYKAMQQDFDLVSENYYEEELAFQEIIDQKSNALKLKDKASLAVTAENILLKLPEDLKGMQKELEVLMYHELEADNDFSFSAHKTTENSFTVPFEKISTGKWIAKVKVHCEGVDYYFDPEIVL